MYASAIHDNEWIVTSTNSDNNELMKPERIYIYHKEHIEYDLNEYDKLKNFDLKSNFDCYLSLKFILSEKHF